jgi:type VI secretion system secreted protein Hcp
MANVDYFLKIDGVDGEAQDSKHTKEIDVKSFSWGMSQTGTSSMGGGGGAGKVKFNDFKVHKAIDAATPKLMEACALGKHIASGLFTARKAGGSQIEFYTIKLTDILISSVTHQPPATPTDVETSTTPVNLTPDELVTINFAQYEISYKTQQKDGTAGGAIVHNLNLKTMS